MEKFLGIVHQIYRNPNKNIIQKLLMNSPLKWIK